jgi:hypothetical protein
MPRAMAAGSHALGKGECPPQLAAPAQSDAGKAWSDLRTNLALPGSDRPSLPRYLPFCALLSLDGATRVEEGLLDCASVHPPPLA